MSLTCSVLGCDFGAVEREEERTERSDEVVITRREAQTCDRCGRKRVLSESKEVTAIEDARDPPAPAATGGPSGGTPDRDGMPSAAEAGRTDPAPSAEPPAGTAAGAEPGAGVGDPWDSVDDTGNATAHIESVGDTEDAAPEGDDAEIIESDPSDGSSAPPGRSPVTAGTDGSAADADAAPDFPETEWAEATTGAGPADEVEYDCPECGATHPSVGSSLRPGDICPDCQTGYIEERPVERNP